MATIGIAIESGSMHAVLVEHNSGEVLADRTTALDADAATVLTMAIETMRGTAASLDADVDAVGVVYSSDSERAEFGKALSGQEATLCSASEAFLGWLAQSKEFADAEAVLLYYMGEDGVSISLADVADASLTQTKTAALDSMSPEHIGSTVPLAWEVVDQSGKKPKFVALFGDSSSNRDLVDILSLGLGVPVVRVGDTSRIAATGAALLAFGEVPARSAKTGATPEVMPVEVEAVEAASDEPDPLPTVASEEVVEPEKAADLDVAPRPVIAAVVPAEPPVVGAQPSRSVRSSRKLVLAAVLLAGALSAGVVVAATLPDDSESTAVQGGEQRDEGADLVGATRHVDPTNNGPAAVLVAPTPAIAPSPETIPPTADPESVVEPALTKEVPVTQNAPRQAVAAPRPAPAPPKVDPPEFTVPAVVPEPGKSRAQLEREAWARHWQHTGEWIEQELQGG